MAQGLRPLVALAEGLDLVPSTQLSVIPVPEDPAPPFGLCEYCMHVVCLQNMQA